MTLEQFDDYINSTEFEPIRDENGVALPNNLLWIVVDPSVTKEHMEMAAKNWGIEFKTAMINGKLRTVSGL